MTSEEAAGRLRTALGLDREDDDPPPPKVAWPAFARFAAEPIAGAPAAEDRDRLQVEVTPRGDGVVLDIERQFEEQDQDGYAGTRYVLLTYELDATAEPALIGGPAGAGWVEQVEASAVAPLLRLETARAATFEAGWI